MLNFWPMLVFGAPSAVVGLGLCLTGALLRSRLLLVAGALVVTPSSLYLGALFLPLFALPVFPLLAALTIEKWGRRTVLLLTPNAAATAFLTVVTLGNLSQLWAA